MTVEIRDGRFVEVQGAGEEATFSRAQLDQLLEAGQKGIATITAAPAISRRRRAPRA